MDDASMKLARGLVTPRYLDAAADAMRSGDSMLRSILAQRRLPDDGFSDVHIEHVLHNIAMMDSNNFPSHCGAGEREGRVQSNIVRRRHYYMSHGIGRSGDLTADQPKACGSSLMSKLSNIFALDVSRISGFRSCKDAVIVPMATGMTIALVLQSVRRQRPATATFVIWPRIDQRTSLKCIEAAGLVPICVELDAVHSADHSEPFYRVSASAIDAAIVLLGADNVVCVLSTTSCFAPRIPDDPLHVARVCKPHAVPVVINNAYGLQSKWIMRRIDAAFQCGGIYGVVQSTDKNLLVPVGGAIVSGSANTVHSVSELYAGRASSSQALDVFITLLGLGKSGFQRILSDRETLFARFTHELRQFAMARNECLVTHPHNEISVGITLRNLSDPVIIGAKLFRHSVTGPKVVTLSERKELCGCEFQAYGSHSNETLNRAPLLVLACGIGMTSEDMQQLLRKLCDVWPAHAE